VLTNEVRYVYDGMLTVQEPRLELHAFINKIGRRASPKMDPGDLSQRHHNP